MSFQFCICNGTDTEFCPFHDPRLLKLMSYAKDTPLCELAAKYNCDKWPGYRGIQGEGHPYTPYYYEIFRPIQMQVKRVLEIGIGPDNAASLRMWADYFPNAEIIGIDIDRSTFVTDKERIMCYKYDITNICELQLLTHTFSPVDIVIEDGPHSPESQIACANLLVPSLIFKGGYYITEDVQRSNESHVWHSVIGKSGVTKSLVRPAYGHSNFDDDCLLVQRI